MTPILLNFPTTKVSACCVRESGEDSVFLNAKCGSNQHLRSYEHEIKHIDRDDFWKGDAALIEAATH